MDAGTKPDDVTADEEPRRPALRPVKPDLLDLLRSEIARVAEAYRRMPHSKFTLRLEPWGTRAIAGRWLAQEFAALAARVEAWPAAVVQAPPLPKLDDFALGDQIAVTGRELLEAVEALEDPAATALQLGDALVPLEKTLAVVLDSTTALRKLL
jgi:hypothetical protein